MSKREKMTPVDTAWLRMDRPSNLMMIVGVMVFDRPVAIDRLRLTLEARLTARFRRFRQRVVQDAVGAWWEDDPAFDIGHHLVRRALPRPAGTAELQQLASELAAEPLAPDRPLWRFDFIERCGGGSAMVARIHHCIADGIALVGVMLSMTDASADAAPPDAPEPLTRAESRARGAADPWTALMAPMTEASLAAFGLTTRFWNGYFRLVSDPQKLMKLGNHTLGFAAELGKLLAMPADSPTRLKGRTGSIKRVAWCEPIPLAEVKAVGKVLGCSVNDVLLSAVAGALRNYLLSRGDSVDGVEIRAMVPVNLRAEKDSGKLGNRFGMVTLLLPLHEANPFVRLFEVRARMNAMKGSYQPPLTLLLLGVAGVAPKMVQEKFLDMLANKASAVMTNVPGPQQPLYLAGGRIDQIMFWVPQSGDIGVGVSILSYNGAVQFGLITDHNFIPDPEAVTPLFRAEFDKMLTALLLHDWAQPFDADALEQSLEAELGVGDGTPGAAKPRRATRKPASEKSTAAGRQTRRRQAAPEHALTSAEQPDATDPAAAASPAESPAPRRIPKRFR